MRILVVGVGALGGYFGGRLAAAGRDVTFLVRPGRAQQLTERGGIEIITPDGADTVANPTLLTAREVKEKFDLILLSCKAMDLDSCMADIAPAVGPATMIVPVLNGMRHIDLLGDRFGRQTVLGGRAFIFAALDQDGRVLLQGPLHTLDFGELDGGKSARTEAALETLANAGFDARLRENIVGDMWEKWVIIATMAGATGSMRSAVGDIVRAGGEGFLQDLLRENAEVASLNGHIPSERALANLAKSLSDPDSGQMASLAKDIDKGKAIEADHIIGDFIARIPADQRHRFPCLRFIYTSLRCYEERRRREHTAR